MPVMTNPDPDVLTLEEAAHLLRLSERKTAELARVGGIPGEKFGRSWRFSRYALLKQLAGE